VIEQHAAVRSRTCPNGHGLLLEDTNLRRVVASSTIDRLHGLIDAAPEAGLGCPVCLHKLHGVELKGVAARGCPACGSLWFDRGAVERHVHDVRRREWGAASFSAREDVENLGADLQATEVVAGLLAYYELELTGAPSSA